MPYMTDAAGNRVRCCEDWNLLCRAVEDWPVCGPAVTPAPFPGVSIGSKFFPLCGPAPIWSSGEYECAQEIDAQGIANELGRPVPIRVGTVVQTYHPGAGAFATGVTREEALIPALIRTAEEQRAERNRTIALYGAVGVGIAVVGAALYYGAKG